MQLSDKLKGILNNTWCCRPVFQLFTLVNFSVTYIRVGVLWHSEFKKVYSFLMTIIFCCVLRSFSHSLPCRQMFDDVLFRI